MAKTWIQIFFLQISLHELLISLQSNKIEMKITETNILKEKIYRYITL